MDSQTKAWLDDVRLPRHREVLRRLLAAVEGDDRFRFVELCCSVARGAGDELSDLDLGLGVADEAWPDAVVAIPPMLATLGDLVDVLSHAIPEWGDAPHRRFFAQYNDGVQVDLVAIPASTRRGLPDGAIALYDPDGRLAVAAPSRLTTASSEDVRTWAFLGWAALADLDKYLRRGSAWEALQRLSDARGYVWRLWAVARDLPYPTFGLVSVLDAPAPELPAGIDRTVASLDPAELRRAAVETARLLETAARAAAAREADEPLPDAMAAYVSRRLEER